MSSGRVQQHSGWEPTVRRGRGLAEEAGATVRSGRTLDSAWLDSAAGWLAEVAPSWQTMTSSDPAGRQYRLITSSLHLEAWLICWPRGGRLELHDHGGASGALRVIEGSLSEWYVPERRLPARHRRIQAGSGIHFDAAYTHDVANVDGPITTSVHVYSAAVRPMAYYHLDDTGMLARPGHVDDAVIVEPDLVVDGGLRLEPATGVPDGRGDHPAGSGRLRPPGQATTAGRAEPAVPG